MAALGAEVLLKLRDAAHRHDFRDTFTTVRYTEPRMRYYVLAQWHDDLGNLVHEAFTSVETWDNYKVPVTAAWGTPDVLLNEGAPVVFTMPPPPRLSALAPHAVVRSSLAAQQEVERVNLVKTFPISIALFRRHATRRV